jgi:hypothetical protein
MPWINHAGFNPPDDIAPGGKRGTSAVVALVMIVALALGTLTAAFAVTMGIAHGNGEHRAYQRLYATGLSVDGQRG